MIVGPNPVIQQDPTGCGIASVAALTGKTYAQVKRAATALGIDVADSRLWTEVRPMRRLLIRHGLKAGSREEPFVSWEKLPRQALLAIKWHREGNGAAWHWVVFVRDHESSYVLDPKRALRHHRRTDFGRMKPKWFIRVTGGAAAG